MIAAYIVGGVIAALVLGFSIYIMVRKPSSSHYKNLKDEHEQEPTQRVDPDEEN